MRTNTDREYVDAKCTAEELKDNPHTCDPTWDGYMFVCTDRILTQMSASRGRVES